MSHVVSKEFKTVNRIMKVGAPVAPGDHLEPHDFEILKKQGFIGDAPAERPPDQTGIAQAGPPMSRGLIGGPPAVLSAVHAEPNVERPATAPAPKDVDTDPDPEDA